MSLLLRPLAKISRQQVADLESALTAFYRNPPSTYYEIADESSQHYQPDKLPFHCDLAARAFPGGTVLELGCGTAHLCPPIESGGALYTGIDHSEALIRQNQQRFPRARFFQIGQPVAETFDIVASLYTIEHVVDPVAYLEKLWSYCKPGGLIGIICPEFVDSTGLPPSVYYGKTPRRLRTKLQQFALLDAAAHVLDVKLRGPRWKKTAMTAAPGAFWINLRPSVLHGAEYAIDADAVHFPRQKDLVWFFTNHGATIVQTSARMSNVPPEVLQFNCYVLARKPAAGTPVPASPPQSSNA